jgi:Nickel responsive protein SCO4226-like
MLRYSVERTVPDGLLIPLTKEAANFCRIVVATNTDDLVTWVHSYLTEDRSKPSASVDAPSPEAIRRAARHNNLPVDKSSEVQVLDPQFYG